jgi:uncharacterized membrane protein
MMLVLLLCAAVVPRVVLALRPGLWGDEIFSLATATGHSLEQPAAEADSTKGDYVEPRLAEEPSWFRRYLQHEQPPAGVRRVLRAVELSDTNPPLYYLLLNLWTRFFGTGDGALRLLSVLAALLALPFIWLLGWELGGRRTAWAATVLFTLSPVSLYYSGEGRMYSLLWPLASALAWQTLRLHRTGPRPTALALWILVATAGLLTHYFFLFVWFAFLVWMLLFPRRLPRRFPLLLAAATGLLVAPWYVQVPASLARWRVSGMWLAIPLPWSKLATRPFELAWSLLAGGSLWGGSPLVDGGLAGLYLLLALWILRRGLLRRVITPPRLLLWLWVLAAVLGPVAFDAVRHTSASLITRYVMAGFPGAMLLAAVGTRQLRPRAQAIFVALVLLAWIPGAWPIFAHPARPGAAYRALDARLEAWAQPSDLILVHSIPSGVLGITRYLTRDLPIASWVAPLGLRRLPDDLEQLLAGRRRVALVQVHNLDQPSPAEPWLRAHARLVRHEIYDAPRDRLTTDLADLSPDRRALLPLHRLYEVFYFAPIDGEIFFSSGSSRW